MRCWGDNTNAKSARNSADPNIGLDPNDMQELKAIDLAKDQTTGGDFVAYKLSSAFNSSCALLDDTSTKNIKEAKVKCWGYGNYGQLGQDSSSNIANPADPNIILLGKGGSPDYKAIKVGIGEYHTCVLLDYSESSEDKGKVKCFGRALLMGD